MKRKTDLVLELAKFFEQDVENLLIKYEKERVEDILPYQLSQVIVACLLVMFVSICFKNIVLLQFTLMATILFSVYQFLIKKLTKNNRHIEFDYEMVIKRQLMPKFLEIFNCGLNWYKYKDVTLIGGNHVITYNNNDQIKTLAQLKEFYQECFNSIKNLKIFKKFFFTTIDDIIIGPDLEVPICIIETKFGIDLKRAIIHAKEKGVGIILLLFVVLFFPFIIMLLNIIGSADNIVFLLISIILFLLSPMLIPFFVFIYIQIQSSKQRNLIIQFKIPKSIKGHTVIFEKSHHFLSGNFERVILEDPAFESKYNTYSTDQIGARYMLTSAFMARFEDIKTAFIAKNIRAEFKDDKLSILIHVDKDMFQMGNITKETTFKTFTTMLDEIYSVLSLSEQLNLDSKTGL